jgi:hypothetical protein
MGISPVYEGRPGAVWVYADCGVKALDWELALGGGADGTRAEAGAGTVGDGCVEGGANDGDVIGGRRGEEAFGVR